MNEGNGNGNGNVNIRKSRRGFASMSPERQREIARQGGRAAHEKGTAHEWNAEEARTAGKKGGQASRRRPAAASPIDGEHATQSADSATWEETLGNDDVSHEDSTDEANEKRATRDASDDM